MAFFSRTQLRYKKVGFNEKKKEYGNIMCDRRIVAMGVAKTDAELLVKRFNTFASKGIFKG
jgi:hypothetical protein